jgi:putative nucleotidyltransferase with HDIG domain
MRDTGTARHSQTVARYATDIATELGLLPKSVERIKLAGVLHDIGKIGVADSILRKPGPLTEDEYHEMQKHSELGARILAGANLEDISGWVWAHHEQPDGNGYPQGLADDDIPLEAKILAVADAYEAMTSDRVYRMAMPAADAEAELRRCSGTQFDPLVVDALLATLRAERAVA